MTHNRPPKSHFRGGIAAPDGSTPIPNWLGLLVLNGNRSFPALPSTFCAIAMEGEKVERIAGASFICVCQRGPLSALQKPGYSISSASEGPQQARLVTGRTRLALRRRVMPGRPWAIQHSSVSRFAFPQARQSPLRTARMPAERRIRGLILKLPPLHIDAAGGRPPNRLHPLLASPNLVRPFASPDSGRAGPAAAKFEAAVASPVCWAQPVAGCGVVASELTST